MNRPSNRIRRPAIRNRPDYLERIRRMGYSEIHCTICGVSFSIGRLRTRDEPRSHAWCYYGEGYCNQYYLPGETGKGRGYDCDPDDGCTFVDRSSDEDNFRSLTIDPKTLWPPDGRVPFHLEHVAGPSCKDLGGYNGHDISISTIRRIRYAQCILRKPTADEEGSTGAPPPPPWQPKSSDEPWESSSDWFLSGLTNQTDERENGGLHSEWYPVRHGVDVRVADEYHFDHFEPADAIGMPFHPWCMEIYQRASFAQKGIVDVNGLGEWWEQADLGSFRLDDLHRGEDLKECSQQYWSHVRGKEYLIMDPLKDEALVGILCDAVDTSETFQPTNSAFPLRKSEGKTGDARSDPFFLLPAELQQQILTYLPTSSIGALRASSRAFTHMPISFFYHLLRKDFPWIWEANPDTSNALPTYSRWMRVVIDGAARDPDGDRFDPPEDATATARNHSAGNDAENYLHPPVLPRHQTNWFKLYAALRKHGSEIPGLKNRKRIWRDCGEILSMVDQIRVREKESEEPEEPEELISS